DLYSEHVDQVAVWVGDAFGWANQSGTASEKFDASFIYAYLLWRQGRTEEAYKRLTNLVAESTAGVNRLTLAELMNLMAEILRARGDRAGAIDAARKAFDYALYQGPPYVFKRELDRAISLLESLGVEPSEIKPFDWD